MKRTVRSVVFCAAVLSPVLAFAEPKTADDWYKEGETQYNLGNFDKAADAFKQGYSLETVDNKKPAYLYNVAQAYRQGKKCKDAAFFYKRYLSLKDQDTAKPLAPEKRTEIEGWISELEECEKNQDSIANKTPDTTIPPGTDDDRHEAPATGPRRRPRRRPARPARARDRPRSTAAMTARAKAVTPTVAACTAATTVEQPKLLSLRFTGGVVEDQRGRSRRCRSSRRSTCSPAIRSRSTTSS